MAISYLSTSGHESRSSKQGKGAREGKLVSFTVQPCVTLVFDLTQYSKAPA